MLSEVTANRLSTVTTFPSDISMRPAVPTDTQKILRLSRSTNIFTASELVCLEEDMESFHAGIYGEGDDGDRVTACEQSGHVVGFAHYGPAPITDGTWFVYWIAVDQSSRAQGLGTIILKNLEQEIRREQGRMILIETSSKPHYEATRQFYLRKGYTLCSTIPDYYANGDSKCIFQKRLG